MINAKPVLENKFWIVEDDGVRVGTISISDDKFMLSSNNNIKYFDNKKQLERTLGLNLVAKISKAVVEETPSSEVHGFPTNTIPYKPMYDVKQRLPLFTKSDKSKSIYCAGYYIIRFDKGWVKSFCPKLITIERYEYKGPFKTEIEMRQELSKANAK